jgi:NAD(P)-dependent dehydrogenase (short-subunit alcohol dehydrogenase family)
MSSREPVNDNSRTGTTTTASPTPSLFSLANRTILITGGARGLGITLAAAVLESGGHCACIDILPSPSEPEWDLLRLLAQKLSPSLSITYHRADITDEAALSAVVATVAENGRQNGAPLRGAVACAGIQKTTLALDYSLEDWNRMMTVNVAGVFLTAKHVARKMVEQGLSGSLVLVASMSGQIANRVGIAIHLYTVSIHCFKFLSPFLPRDDEFFELL